MFNNINNKKHLFPNEEFMLKAANYLSDIEGNSIQLLPEDILKATNDLPSDKIVIIKTINL
jgi:hypothetical protein